MKLLAALFIAGLGVWGYAYVHLSRNADAPLEPKAADLSPTPAILPAGKHAPEQSAVVVKGAVNWPAQLVVTVLGFHPDFVASERVAVVLHQGGGRYVGPIPGSWGFHGSNNSSLEVWLPPTPSGLVTFRATVCGKDHLLAEPFSIPIRAMYHSRQGFIVN